MATNEDLDKYVYTRVLADDFKNHIGKRVCIVGIFTEDDKLKYSKNTDSK